MGMPPAYAITAAAWILRTGRKGGRGPPPRREAGETSEITMASSRFCCVSSLNSRFGARIASAFHEMRIETSGHLR